VLINALNTWFGSVVGCETFHAGGWVWVPANICWLPAACFKLPPALPLPGDPPACLTLPKCFPLSPFASRHHLTPADVHAGNLLVLPDGRVGFIDFGIVGRISPVTWRAIEALLLATGAGDYDTMARALVTIGAASGEVDIKVGRGWQANQAAGALGALLLCCFLASWLLLRCFLE
jgi:hypothetical protein